MYGLFIFEGRYKITAAVEAVVFVAAFENRQPVTAAKFMISYPENRYSIMLLLPFMEINLRRLELLTGINIFISVTETIFPPVAAQR